MMKTRAWYVWLMIAVAILWHAGGIMNFLMMQSPEMLAQMPPKQQAFMGGQPLGKWSFALSVFAGTIAGVLWLIRNTLAPTLFLIAAAGALVTLITAFSYGTMVWAPTFASAIFALGCASLARRFG